MLNEGEEKYEPLPKQVEDVLMEFADVMPKELPKKLPPRREVDHAIELEPGAKPPSKSPYRMSPPELAIGQQPLTPNTVVTGYTGNSPAAFKTAKEWQLAHELARAHLEKASKKMKKWADRKRRNVEFQTGDQVFVKLNASQHKSTRGLHKSLLRKYEGPFPIIKKVGKAAYVVELPPRLKFHPVFHVSNLKPYHADNEEPSRGESHRAPPLMTEAFDKEVESIEAKRVVVRPRQPKHVEYFVKWKGLPYSEATWEKETSLWQYKDLIQTFERQESTRTSTA
nr:uncharacterized protein LOC114824969 isoform X1 [Malus domestica]